MIEAKERTGSEGALGTRSTGTGGRRRRGTWLFAAVGAVAVAGTAVAILATREPAPAGKTAVVQAPVVRTVDGSRVDVSDQAFRYGQVQLIDGSKVDLSDQAFRPMYLAAAPAGDTTMSETQLRFVLQHP